MEKNCFVLGPNLTCTRYNQTVLRRYTIAECINTMHLTLVYCKMKTKKI